MNENLIEEINNNLKKIINPLSKKDIISDKIVKSTEIKSDKIVVIQLFIESINALFNR